MEGEENKFNRLLKSIFKKWIKEDRKKSEIIEEYRDKKILDTLNNIIVREIMTLRSDMVVIDSTALINDLIKIIVDSEHSKIPVVNSNIDNIIGIVYAKDLFKFLNKPDISINEIIRAPFFVPETKNVYRLLQ